MSTRSFTASSVLQSMQTSVRTIDAAERILNDVLTVAGLVQTAKNAINEWFWYPRVLVAAA